jgi:hypothetical protein
MAIARSDTVTVTANIYGATLNAMNQAVQAFAEEIGTGALAVDITMGQITGNPDAQAGQEVAAQVTYRFIYPNGTV